MITPEAERLIARSAGEIAKRAREQAKAALLRHAGKQNPERPYHGPVVLALKHASVRGRHNGSAWPYEDLKMAPSIRVFVG